MKSWPYFDENFQLDLIRMALLWCKQISKSLAWTLIRQKMKWEIFSLTLLSLQKKWPNFGTNRDSKFRAWPNFGSNGNSKFSGLALFRRKVKS